MVTLVTEKLNSTKQPAVNQHALITTTLGNAPAPAWR